MRLVCDVTRYCGGQAQRSKVALQRQVSVSCHGDGNDGDDDDVGCVGMLASHCLVINLVRPL